MPASYPALRREALLRGASVCQPKNCIRSLVLAHCVLGIDEYSGQIIWSNLVKLPS